MYDLLHPRPTVSFILDDLDFATSFISKSLLFFFLIDSFCCCCCFTALKFWISILSASSYDKSSRRYPVCVPFPRNALALVYTQVLLMISRTRARFHLSWKACRSSFFKRDELRCVSFFFPFPFPLTKLVLASFFSKGIVCVETDDFDADPYLFPVYLLFLLLLRCPAPLFQVTPGL